MASAARLRPPPSRGFSLFPACDEQVRSKAPKPALQLQPEAPPPARRPSQQKVGIEQRLEEALAAGEARGAEFYEKS